MQVWEAPEGADVLAWSDKTGVEMFCVGDRVLGIQGHPEYTGDILLSLIDRLASSDSITVSTDRSSITISLKNLNVLKRAPSILLAREHHPHSSPKALSAL